MAESVLKRREVSHEASLALTNSSGRMSPKPVSSSLNTSMKGAFSGFLILQTPSPVTVVFNPMDRQHEGLRKRD